MEKFQELRENAKKRLKIADHLLTVTYPMIRDPKLLVTTLNNLHSSLESGMNSLLEHEKLFKNISILPELSETRFEFFRSEVASRLKIKSVYTNLIKEVRDTIGCHEHSPVEFARKDKFVMCSDEFDIKTLSPEKLRDQVNQTKEFIDIVEGLVGKNERIFGRSA